MVKLKLGGGHWGGHVFPFQPSSIQYSWTWTDENVTCTRQIPTRDVPSLTNRGLVQIVRSFPQFPWMMWGADSKGMIAIHQLKNFFLILGFDMCVTCVCLATDQILWMMMMPQADRNVKDPFESTSWITICHWTFSCRWSYSMVPVLRYMKPSKPTNKRC